MTGGERVLWEIYEDVDKLQCGFIVFGRSSVTYFGVVQVGRETLMI